MIWISLVVTVSVCLLAKLHLLEYEIVCIGGYDGPHENVLGICPDGEKAYVTYSTLRYIVSAFNMRIRYFHIHLESQNTFYF